MLSSHTKPAPQPRILVISLDFDGCVFNNSYRTCTEKSRLLDTNSILTNHLASYIKAGNYDCIIFMSSSNRQSYQTDRLNLNHNKTESSFTALLEISEAISQMTNIPCTVDKYLLADTYGARPAGENFSKAVSQEDYQYSSFIWDEYKYSILYAHMHKIASENQGADITHHVYDDKTDILHHLTMFYHDNRLLMPANLKLRLYRYNGYELELHHLKQVYKTYYDTEAQGAGVKDTRYSENIITMAHVCGYSIANESENTSLQMQRSKGISGTLTDYKVLTAFKKNRILTLDNLLFEMDYEAAAAENKLQNVEKFQFFIVLCELRKQLALAKNNPSLHIEAVRIAKDVVHLLRDLQLDYALQRHQQLMNFINNYGQSFGNLWSAARTLSNSVYGLFFTPAEIHKQAYNLAEALKPLISADERATDMMKHH